MVITNKKKFWRNHNLLRSPLYSIKTRKYNSESMPIRSLVKKRNATDCSVAKNSVRAESMPALRPSFRMMKNSVGLCIYLPALLFVTCVAAMNAEEAATGSSTAIKTQYAMVSE